MTTPYTPAATRYTATPPEWFRRCGTSGLRLPAISLGCWHNFGGVLEGWNEQDWHDNARRMLFEAFDLGITHFDLANNYGPPAGSAEERVGRILHEDFPRHRDELIISTKAGYHMWEGPYGEWGSRKYLLASLDQSLARLKLDYVDIFYSHRFDPDTPLEETLGALDTAVRQGKALYAGISNYRGVQTAQTVRICERDGLVKPIIHQPQYHMFNRWIEDDLLPQTQAAGMGVICFSPLAQGLLSDKYLAGIPEGSRAATKTGFLRPKSITDQRITQARSLNTLAQARGQSLAQMALAWVLRHRGVTSALIGASKPQQIKENVDALRTPSFTAEELAQIDAAIKGNA